MNKKLKFIGLILPVIAIGLWGWKKWDASREPLKYQDLAVKNPYEALARDTGGQVLKFDKNQMDLAAQMALQADRESSYATLWTAEGVPASEFSEFKFMVDSSVTELSVFVSAIDDLPEVTILDAGGRSVTPEKSNNSKTAIQSAIALPKSGEWKLKIRARSNLHIQIKGKTDVQLESVRIMKIGGRPGHQGYFESNDPLENGKKEIVSLRVSGAEGITNARMKAISLSGQILEEVGVDGAVDVRSAEMNEKIKTPGESFRILLEGKNKGNEYFQRMDTRIFSLNRFEMVEFRARIEETKNSETCQILSHSSHWSMLAGTPAAAGSASLACVVYADAQSSKTFSNFNFHIPVSPDGKHLKLQIFSPEYRKLTKAECDQANTIFARYPRELKSSSGHRLTWAFKCEGGPNDYRAVMDITTARP